jgi:hypothetical protein
MKEKLWDPPACFPGLPSALLHGIARVRLETSIGARTAIGIYQFGGLYDVVHAIDDGRAAGSIPDVIGQSAALKNVVRQTTIVGPTDSTVLILGETGSGKGLC